MAFDEKNVTTVVDPGSELLELTDVDGQETTINKRNAKVDKQDNPVGCWLTDVGSEASYFVRFSGLIAPASATNDALFDNLQTMINNLPTPAPSGTQDVNLTEVLGAAHSASNPVFTQESPTASTEFAASSDNSAAYESSSLAKASAGNLYGFTGYNSGPEQWIQIHNASAVPADAAVPVIIIKAGSNQNFSWGSGDHPVHMATGIVICNSTTGPTKTIGAADCWFNVIFE